MSRREWLDEQFDVGAETESGTMERLSSGTQVQIPMSFSRNGMELIFGTPTTPPYDLA